MNEHEIKIPKIFHSDLTGQPFQTCIHCNHPLLSGHEHYVIEKAVKRYPNLDTTDTIFEYAICMNCHAEMMRSVSIKSMTNIQTYFKDHVNFEQRTKELIQGEQFDLNDWIGTCLIESTPIKTCQEYQLYCECRGDKMVFNLMPYMISGPVLDEIMDLLSDQTLDFLDGFKDNVLGPSPEFEELLNPRRVLLL